MSNAFLEVGLEDTICDALSQRGWTYEDNGSDAGFNPSLGLHTADVLHWLQAQYPDAYDKAVPAKLTGKDRERAEFSLLSELATQLDKKPVVGRKTGQPTAGLLHILHSGFTYSRPGRPLAKFGPMVAFPPEDPLTLTAVKKAEGNILRVMRQVHFSTEKTKDTIDLVLTVNGIPVATLELKSDSTQNVINAINQYREDRIPGAHARILQPGRCLVHFAVSDDEVYMTTKLAGPGTFFLPFNKGKADGHAGNDPIEGGIATQYLWRNVLSREMFLRILNSYAFFEPKEKKIGADGTLIFPRFHQLRAVENVMGDIEANGPGKSYLIWHSAGSGKTKTIAWLAHRMIRHVSQDGESTFDSVILVSDRTVLDKNLRDSVQMLRASEGLVTPITRDKDYKSKSEKLADVLETGNTILTCTLQTFPEVLNKIESDAKLRKRRWAIIADEAHASQTGKTATALRQLLADIGEDVPEDEEMSGDDLLLYNQRRMTEAVNMTYVALTATPKPKTLQLFGTKHDAATDVGYEYRAFDTYTMAQAIDEGFILDVLQNYSTYEMFARVAEKAESEDSEVELIKGVSDVYKFVRLHDTALAQKVQIVVEHFKTNVLGKLDGQARAMVVTSSREQAVKWARAFNQYLEDHNYKHLFKALVAFSGSLTLDETGEHEYTEANMNGLGDVEKAFKDDDMDYRVLIVAEKFQTGFNEPRLLAMYVDKKLKDLEAVQTLSRLNRTHEGKTAPMVVDFVNDENVILDAFQRYYQDAAIVTPTDPAVLEQMGVQLDAFEYYTEADMDAIARAVAAGKDATHTDFMGPLQRIAAEWKADLREARLNGDEEGIEMVKGFRKLTRKYVSAWEFLTQVLDYRDPVVHKRALLLSHLRRLLIDDAGGTPQDYGQLVRLEGLSMQPAMINQSLGLTSSSDAENGEWTGEQFEAEIKSGAAAEPELGPLQEVVERINEMLAARGKDTDLQAAQGFVSTTWGNVKANEEIAALVRDNTDEQLRNSTSFGDILMRILWQQRQGREEIDDLVMFDEEGIKFFRDQILEQLIRDKHEGEDGN